MAQVTVIFASTEKMAALVKPLESLKGRVSMVVYWGPGHVHAVKARPQHQRALASRLMPSPRQPLTSCGRCLCVVYRTWKDTERAGAAVAELRLQWSAHLSRPC